jgi:hypothetical protein
MSRRQSFLYARLHPDDDLGLTTHNRLVTLNIDMPRNPFYESCPDIPKLPGQEVLETKPI